MQLKRDEWHINEAVMIVCDINPSPSATTVGIGGHNPFDFETITFFGDETIPPTHADTGVPLHYGCTPAQCEICDEYFNQLEGYKQWCTNTKLLLQKESEVLTYQSPHFWIERAIEKGISPDWLNSAIENKLYTPDKSRTFSPVGIKEMREKLLVDVATHLEYLPPQLPLGAKKKIKLHCIDKHPDIFSDSTFDKAWQTASKSGVLRIINSEKYHPNKTKS